MKRKEKIQNCFCKLLLLLFVHSVTYADSQSTTSGIQAKVPGCRLLYHTNDCSGAPYSVQKDSAPGTVHNENGVAVLISSGGSGSPIRVEYELAGECGQGGALIAINDCNEWCTRLNHTAGGLATANGVNCAGTSVDGVSYCNCTGGNTADIIDHVDLTAANSPLTVSTDECAPVQIEFRDSGNNLQANNSRDVDVRLTALRLTGFFYSDSTCNTQLQQSNSQVHSFNTTMPQGNSTKTVYWKDSASTSGQYFRLSALIPGILWQPLNMMVCTRIPGDFNSDRSVDAADYVIWRANNGMTSGAKPTQGDADGDGDVDNSDYDIWRANFGTSTPCPEGGYNSMY